MPSLKMNAYSSSQVVFNVRGVSQNDYGDQQELPVAVYQDDSYSSSINLASFPVFDLARVGSAARAAGHAVRPQRHGWRHPVRLEQADEEFEGYGTLTLGSFNQVISNRPCRAHSATTSRHVWRASATRMTATWSP